MSTIIRAASPDDAAAIASVHMASLRASSGDLLPTHLTPLLLPPSGGAPRALAWKRWLGRRRTSTFVAVVGTTVTGFCTLHPAPDESGTGVGEIASFYVLPAEWRRGTGRRLGERAVAEGRARGFAEVVLWVLETNARARSFYEALGFRPDGESRVFLERPYASWRELRYRRRAAWLAIAGSCGAAVSPPTPGPLQPRASDALRTSVTSMCAGVWVIAMGGRAARRAT